MELKRLEIQNFLAIGEGIIDFNRPSGITLIQGENNDSPTSVSNGAGKSSVFEALFWALYGKTKRGVTGDAVINREAKKNCSVVLFFDNYQIIRTRKPNALQFFQVDSNASAAAKYTDLTKGTAKETQALIEEVIKVSELTFSKIAYFGQEDVKAFASLTDAELKKVFEQALALTFLTEHHQKAKAHMEAVKADLATKEQSKATLELQMKEAEDRIEILRKAAKDLEDRKDTEKARILADIAADQGEIEALKQKYIYTQAEAKQAKAQAQEIQKKLNQLLDLKKPLIDKHDEQVRKATGDRSNADRNLSQVKDLQQKVKAAPNAVGQACDTCKRPFTEADIANVIASLKEKIAHHEARHKQLDEQAKFYESKVNEVEALIAKLEDAIDVERQKIHGALPQLNPRVTRNALVDIERQVQALINRVESNQRVLLKLDSDSATYDTDITDTQAFVDDRTLEVGMLYQDIAALQVEFDTASMLVEVLGNAGMKSYIFDNVTPELNREINKLAALLDEMEIEVSTVKLLRNGEFREKFHINVENRHGADAFNGNSGGEKQKANLAIALGFNKVFRAMSEGAVNAVFLDEPFESLDKGSSEAVIELCKAFSDVGNVFVITHQDAIKDLITDVITVKKDGRKAMIC